MIEIPAVLNVLLTIDGAEIGEWPDHEVTLLVDDDGELSAVQQPAMRDTGICTQRITSTVDRLSTSETARCIWAAAQQWVADNPGELANHLPPVFDPPGRPHYGSWQVRSRI